MAELLTAREAAHLLHLHEKRVQALARSGRLPAIRHGRKWLFKRSDLLRSSQGTTESNGAVEISARNRLSGRIVDIRADGVMAEVQIDVSGQELVAVITNSSVQRLGLQIGDQILAVVKATEVMVARPAD